MGYTNLYLVPKDPEFAPARDAIRRLQDWLRPWMAERFMDGDPNIRESARPMYFGTVPDALRCPSCGRPVDLSSEELDEWAYDFRNALWTAPDARDLAVAMPCCGATLRAGELPLENRAKWCEAHYARFAVYLPDAHDEEFSPMELRELEAILGCELHQFTESGT